MTTSLRISHGTGNPNAKIFFIKDSPSFEEVRKQEFFADSAGTEFKRMMLEAGIPSTEVFCSSVTRDYVSGKKEEIFSAQPKFRANKVHFEDKVFVRESIASDLKFLLAEIEAVKPNVIVPISPFALYLCNKEDSISTWRGSVNHSPRFNCKFIPTYDPSMILKVYNWRYIAVRDLQRISAEADTNDIKLPDYNFQIQPSFAAVMIQLQKLIAMADNG